MMLGITFGTARAWARSCRCRTRFWENNSQGPPEGEPGLVTRVYVQTFENSSAKSVRIYHVFEDVTGAVIKSELVDMEGPVG